MPPDETDAAYLWDMLQAAREVQVFVAGRTQEDYVLDRLLQAAVERKIEIIGEAARRISSGFQAAHPAIPWRPIMAQRHVLAHDYGQIDHERIWRVVSVHIPELIDLLVPLIPAEPPEPDSDES
ncbi:MAG: HepT-like ribonuclease domain-containing protein [Planctomycetaceae bacterium]